MLIKQIVKGSAIFFVGIVAYLFYHLIFVDLDSNARAPQPVTEEEKALKAEAPLEGPMQQKKEVIVYSTPTCPYCVEAKSLLKSLRIHYVEKNVMEEDHRAEMMKNTGNARGVPQIMIGSEHIGGYYELSQLHERGQLVDMVSGKGSAGR